MRIYMPCMTCLKEGRVPPPFYGADIEDNGVYRINCDRSHESVVCLQEQKFEMLFDLAVHAILDGYYREAVSSFTSAMERFFEFYIGVQCVKGAVDPALFDEAWREVSNQSERQLGAFVFTYLLAMKKKPMLLKGPDIKFRNSVIHKGHIPTREKAIQYGERVANIVLATLSELRQRDTAWVNAAIGRHVAKVRNSVPDVGRVSFMCSATMLSLSRADTEPQPSLRAWIEVLRARRGMERSGVGGPAL